MDSIQGIDTFGVLSEFDPRICEQEQAPILGWPPDTGCKHGGSIKALHKIHGT
jgi:hypothetical protein